MGGDAQKVMHKSQRRQGPVLVWTWNLDTDPLCGAAGEALLSDDEKERCRRLVSSQLRRRFVAGRARLRSLLAEQLGQDPRRLAFVQNEYGKPRLAQAPAVHFSLSHSDDMAMLAVSDTLEIGADIERMRAIDHLDLARRYFHPNEAAAIARPSSADHQLRTFFHIWTLKEAVVKALGKGLSLPLDTFEVSTATSPPVMVRAPEGPSRTWWLNATTGAYCRALAVPGGVEVELIQRTV